MTSTEEIEKNKKKKAAEVEDKILGNLKKISYNIRSQLDTFVVEFVNYDGIKEIMKLIEETQAQKSYDLVTVSC